MSDVISDLGYLVDVAYDGPAALELSRQHPYGLALEDYKLPGVDSVELYGRIKRARAGSVGVLMTGFAADDTIQAAIGAGIRRVLPKRHRNKKLVPVHGLNRAPSRVAGFVMG
jgi:CheY-like chemotaxis protein